ncbi:MAG: hypothetical protein EP335_15860 [Alphaproteobacteria bacterium]|nr:MAG: hypothetical protein EP335_15860 [Alphaproteobacteria bacterium]
MTELLKSMNASHGAHVQTAFVFKAGDRKAIFILDQVPGVPGCDHEVSNRAGREIYALMQDYAFKCDVDDGAPAGQNACVRVNKSDL